MKIQLRLLTALLVLMLGAGCAPNKQSRDGDDGGVHITPEACHVASMSCHTRCSKREAGNPCRSCCLDQYILCKGGEKYSIESCEKLP
jgi:hypothetical protein